MEIRFSQETGFLLCSSITLVVYAIYRIILYFEERNQGQSQPANLVAAEKPKRKSRPVSNGSTVDELERLASLHQSGALTDSEFARLKEQVIEGGESGLSGDVDDEVKTLLRAGNKIAAIKVYREATGLGLKESKDAVDEIERLMGRM